MAVFRPTPKCPYCGEVIAEGKYLDQSDIPPMQRLIGDTFLGWKYFDHTCPGLEENDRQLKEEFDKWRQEMKDKGIPLPPFFKED